MLNRRIRLLASVLAGLTAAATVSACSSKDSANKSGDTIVIGLDCDTTGPGASYARPSCDATKDTIALVNSKGGVNGKQLRVVKVNVESAPIDATDLSAEVARVKAGQPDAVMVGTSAINFEILAQNTFYQQLPGTPRFTEATLGGVPAAWAQAHHGALNGVVGF